MFPLAVRLPFPLALAPGDSLELRGAAPVLHSIDTILDVVVECLRCSCLGRVVSEVLLLAALPPGACTRELSSST